MYYKCLSNKSYLIENLELRALNMNSIEYIRKIRNSQIDILRQDKLISKNKQKKYFEEHVWNDMGTKPKNILLAIYRDQLLIGYGGLVHISWVDKRAELSFIIDKKISNFEKEKIQLCFIKQIKKIFFKELKMNKIFTETFSFRTEHIKVLENGGFHKEAVLKKHILYKNKFYDSIFHGCFK